MSRAREARAPGARRGIRPALIGSVAVLLAACTPYGPVQTLTWGEALGAAFAFFILFAAFWIFIGLFVDIFRRHDLSGGMKALWLLVLVVLPLIGSLVYIALRPRRPAGTAMQYRSEEMSSAEEFAELDRMRSEGKISDADYEEYKRMAAARKAPPPES